MGLATFPLLQNHSCLITYNNTVFKLKLEYEAVSQHKRETTFQIVSERTAHCEIEDVCRAILYNIERKEELSPIQTEHFIIYPHLKKWPLVNKFQFTVNGKPMNCHQDFILLKLNCKDIVSFSSDIPDTSKPKSSTSRLCDGQSDITSVGNEQHVVCTSDSRWRNNVNSETQSFPYVNNALKLYTPALGINNLRGCVSPESSSKIAVLLHKQYGLVQKPAISSCSDSSEYSTDRPIQNKMPATNQMEYDLPITHNDKKTTRQTKKSKLSPKQCKNKKPETHVVSASEHTSSATDSDFPDSVCGASVAKEVDSVRLDKLNQNYNSAVNSSNQKNNEQKKYQGTVQEKQCHVSSFWMSERDVVDVSDDGTRIYHSKLIHNNLKTNPQDATVRNDNRKRKGSSLPIKTQTLSKETDVESVTKEIQNSFTDTVEQKGNLKKKQNSSELHINKDDNATNTPQKPSHRMARGYSLDNEHSTTKNKRRQRKKRRSESVSVRAKDSHPVLEQNIQANPSTSESSKRNAFLTSKITTKESNRQSGANQLSETTNRSCSPHLKTTVHFSKAERQFLEVRVLLTKSKDGVWLF